MRRLHQWWGGRGQSRQWSGRAAVPGGRKEWQTSHVRSAACWEGNWLMCASPQQHFAGAHVNERSNRADDDCRIAGDLWRYEGQHHSSWARQTTRGVRNESRTTQEGGPQSAPPSPGHSSTPTMAQPAVMLTAPARMPATRREGRGCLGLKSALQLMVEHCPPGRQGTPSYLPANGWQRATKPTTCCACSPMSSGPMSPGAPKNTERNRQVRPPAPAAEFEWGG